MTKDLRFFYKNEENSSVNDEKDVLLASRKVSEQNWFSTIPK